MAAAAMDEVRAVCDADRALLAYVKSMESSLRTARETLDAGLLTPEDVFQTTRSQCELLVKAIDKRLPANRANNRLCIRLPAGAARLPPPVARSPTALLQGKKGKRGQAEPSSTTRPKRKRRKKTLVPAIEPSSHLATDPTQLRPSTPPLETMPPTSFQPCDPLEVGCLGVSPENWNFNPTLSPLCSDASDDDDDDDGDGGVYKGGGGGRCGGMVDDRATVKMMSIYHFHPTPATPPGGVPTKPFRDGRSKKKRNLCAIPPFPPLAAVQLGGGFRLDYSEFSKSFKKGRGKGPGRRRKAQKDGVERAMARGAEELLQGLGCPHCKWDRAGCLGCRQRGKRQSGRARRPPTRLSSDGEWKRTMECDQLKKH